MKNRTLTKVANLLLSSTLIFSVPVWATPNDMWTFRLPDGHGAITLKFIFVSYHSKQVYKIHLSGHFNKGVLDCTLPEHMGDTSRYINYYPAGNGTGALLVIGDPHADKQNADIVSLERPDGNLQLSSKQLSMLKHRMTTEEAVKVAFIDKYGRFFRTGGDVYDWDNMVGKEITVSGYMYDSKREYLLTWDRPQLDIGFETRSLDSPDGRLVWRLVPREIGNGYFKGVCFDQKLVKGIVNESRGNESQTFAAWEQLLKDLREDEWPEVTVTGKLFHETEVHEAHKDFGNRLIEARLPTPDYAMCTPDIVVVWKDKAGHTRKWSQKNGTKPE